MATIKTQTTRTYTIELTEDEATELFQDLEKLPPPPGKITAIYRFRELLNEALQEI